ncbi:MAG: hypothetical protein JWL62_3327 [Hyphomicrobiales bacterium]|nr:hypothetical protein [Hyphomicrobiales bacterium]
MNSNLKKVMVGTLAAVTMAGSLVAFSSDASAQYRRYGHGYHRGGNGGAIAAGAIGGLALGALAAGAYGSNGYGYGPGYAAPVYGSGYGNCYFTTQRAWDGYGWVRERVRVCE